VRCGSEQKGSDREGHDNDHVPDIAGVDRRLGGDGLERPNRIPHGEHIGDPLKGRSHLVAWDEESAEQELGEHDDGN
jgi:hypothetical protein